MYIFLTFTEKQREKVREKKRRQRGNWSPEKKKQKNASTRDHNKRNRKEQKKNPDQDRENKKINADQKALEWKRVQKDSDIANPAKAKANKTKTMKEVSDAAEKKTKEA